MTPDQRPVTVVTGGSKGIGKAVAASQARVGHKIALVARNQRDLEEAAADIAERSNAPVLSIAADVSEPGAMDEAVQAVLSQWNRIDVLVNSAGASRMGGILDVDVNAWSEDYKTKLFGAVMAIRAVLPAMIGERSGNIINIAGTSGRQASLPTHMIGGSINAAMVHLTKTVSLQVGRYGIRVNAVSPGAVQTERWQGVAEKFGAEAGISAAEWSSEKARNTPLGRVGKPSEIADTVTYLASDKASFITGAHLVVDGGAIQTV